MCDVEALSILAAIKQIKQVLFCSKEKVGLLSEKLVLKDHISANGVGKSMFLLVFVC